MKHYLMNKISSNFDSCYYMRYKVAGEFAVLSQLALRGYDARIVLGHTKNADILVSDSKTGKMFKLEIKTNCYIPNPVSVEESKIFGKYTTDWIMGKKHENIIDPTFFYCFVSLSQSGHNTLFFIVPSNIVAKYVKDEHNLWLKAKRRKGKKIKDVDMRLFRVGFSGVKYDIKTPSPEKYENNWGFKV